MPFVRPFPGSAEGEGVIVTAGDLQAQVDSLVLNTKGLKELTLMCDVTRPGAGVTDVQMFIDNSPDGVQMHPLMDKEEVAAPVKVLEAEQETKAIPGPGTTLWSTTVIVSAPFMRFRFTDTGAVSGDLLDVDAYGRG